MKTITAEAIFQDGVIKVLTEVPLEENERIKLQIERAPHRAQRSSRNLLHLRGIWKEHLKPMKRTRTGSPPPLPKYDANPVKELFAPQAR